MPGRGAGPGIYGQWRVWSGEWFNTQWNGALGTLTKHCKPPGHQVQRHQSLLEGLEPRARGNEYGDTMEERNPSCQGEGTFCTLSHGQSLSAWRFHLRRSLSHKWVGRQGSHFYINSKPWNSFWGGSVIFVGKNTLINGLG